MSTFVIAGKLLPARSLRVEIAEMIMTENFGCSAGLAGFEVFFAAGLAATAASAIAELKLYKRL